MRFSIRHCLFIALLWAASFIQMHASEPAKLPPLACAELGRAETR